MPISYLVEFRRWDFYSPLDNQLKTVDASYTPFITYDNGVPCYEANMYMQKQLITQQSRRVKGGTLKTYAKHIHHLVRYCYKNSLRFSQLTDDRLRLFVYGLQGERDKVGVLSRSNNHTIQIVHRCIDFLMFIKDCHSLDNFIGEGKENAIQIILKQYTIMVGSSKNMKKVTTLTHQSVPTKDSVKRRYPVSQDSALKVWSWIQSQKNQDKRVRDTVLYQCLEQLGARVSEIHLLKVKDVENAVISGNEPFLVMTTLKRKDGNETRSIPVTHSFLGGLIQYIRKARRKIIKNTLGKDNDHGYLFVSITTGKPFQSSSTTSYLNLWKKQSGVKSEFHPHLFRHAFITNKLKEIILQHNEITSADKFREHLLHTEKFKFQLQQWTGHTNINSLDTYISLVFADINGYNKAYSTVQLNDSVKVMRQKIEQVKLELNSKVITVSYALDLFNESLGAFEIDIESALKNNIT